MVVKGHSHLTFFKATVFLMGQHITYGSESLLCVKCLKVKSLCPKGGKEFSYKLKCSHLYL